MDTPEIQDLATGWRRGKLSRAELLRRLAIGGLTLSGALALLEEEGAAAENRSYWERVGGRFKGQTLVVTSYGGTWQDFMLSDHIPDFERQTGAKVELAVGLAKDWFSKMRAAGKHNPPYDVFVTNETYLAQLRLQGFFTPLPLNKVPNIKYVPSHLRQKDNVGVLGLVGALGIVYNSSTIKDKPRSWKDLAKYGTDVAIFT
ncbi:MAG TPA: extracellular solute-binding protein, partial [Chloroflexota bacterium]|nr:extracellular solute-binding protein [Chloroflexota bacterium]